MRNKSRCHPDRPELFSYRSCSPWERGLCGDCRAKAKGTRTAQRELMLARMEKKRKADLKLERERGPRTADRFITTVGVNLAAWTALVQAMGGVCFYCRRASASLSINYVVPLHRGGKDLPNNALPCCPRCAHRKGKRLITEWPAATELLKPAAYAALAELTNDNVTKVKL